MLNVEPVTAPFVTEVCLALCNLVCVMREDIVNTAAMNIKVFAEIFHAYAAALNVPAGVTDAPRAVPFQLLLVKFGFRKPESEVALVFLVFVLGNIVADADHKVFRVVCVTGKLAVACGLGCVKIHVSAGDISIALVYKRGNDADEFVNTARGRLNDFRLFDVQRVAIRKEGVRIELRDLHNRLMLALCALEHLVLARVRVARQVTDICYVHRARDVISRKAQVFFKHVLHHICAQISYMCIMINGRAAGIHFHLAAFVRHEFLNRFCKRIIKLHIASGDI